MSQSILGRAPRRGVLLATGWTLGILLMTGIHHVYGANLFSTPWRLHIVYISIPAAILIVAAAAIGRSSPSSIAAKTASWLYLALSALFAVGAIGVYEGGYNHLLPNLQYVLGVEHVLREGLYEPPDDLFFQLTGIAQFLVAAIAAWHLARLTRDPEGRAAPDAGRRSPAGSAP